ncbi:Hypothetical predicted protein [Mytilus galloprovincialis]|uniref:Uncharacterized protein n=1 Tax=Mytilus galloprovincialis TaxID=29158 RepID=A0A8B6E291_MYTGA|nr:Hypothetical predicted protein [Mytilus galloprovincialis]
MASKNEESLDYFDMNLKGVYKLNKTAHLRLNLYVNKLEKRQEQSMVRIDHDIRETKRQIARMEDEKNKLVMKLLKSYVSKTTQKKKKPSRLQESIAQSRSGFNSGFTFSTYLDVPGQSNKGSSTVSENHPAISRQKRPVSIHFPTMDSNLRMDSVHEGRAMSDFAFPFRRHGQRESSRQDSRISKRNEIQRYDNHSRVSTRSRLSNRLDNRSRISNRCDINSRASKTSMISDLAATRGQILGAKISEHAHNQKVKDLLGGNTCLFRGHHPPRGYNIEPLHKLERGILPSEIHSDDHIEPSKLLQRIKIFGNVKLPNVTRRHNLEIDPESSSQFHPRRLLPTLPQILSNTKSTFENPQSVAESPFQTKPIKPTSTVKVRGLLNMEKLQKI